ncbi:MAG TPA: tetratricopeptide repeat protein [Thermoanaerobaculia bacterium]|jgi:tetratricopeptide (TPR) repeat protein|nr:tetratricopeptide repeat protein [Thermoanaerobaculia bacterium]
MSRSGAESGARRALRFALTATWASLATVSLGLFGARPASAAAQGSGFELGDSVSRTLHQLQDQAVQWLVQSDPEHSGERVTELLETARTLGFERFPDLARGALFRAVDGARRGDFALSRQALAAAERLDPGRPEISFASATVARIEGSYATAAAKLVVGIGRTLTWPFERRLLLEGALLWSLWLLLATAGLFLVIQMTAKGGALLADIGRIFSGSGRGSRFTVPFAVAVLVWPLVLPSGFIWLLLWWSVLLWGYASASERTVLAGAWLLLAAAPPLLAEQRQRLAIALSPPALALDSLERRELSGDLFNDLGTLRTLVPDSFAVRQLAADIHRHLGQWERARELYQEVIQKEPGNSAALVDVGAYYLVRHEYAQAIEQFKRAGEIDPTSAEAQYNLSWAYRGSYRFEEAERADAQARVRDRSLVEGWVQRSERVVSVDGGFERIPEIRSQLEVRIAGPVPGHRSGDLLRRYGTAGLALGLLLAALGLDVLRRNRQGYSAVPLDLKLGSRPWQCWLRVLLPGLPSAEVGDGFRGFCAVLVALALASIPFLPRLGFRLPSGFGPGQGVAGSVALVGLVTYFIARYRFDLANEI